MSPTTEVSASETGSTDVTDQPNSRLPPHSDRRLLARRLAIVVTIICALAALYPAVAGPLMADDRYWYLYAVGRTDGSFVELFRSTWENVPERVSTGRLNVLTYAERTFAAVGLTNLSVATATPVAAFQALLKIGLLGAGVLTVVAFVRTLRWRATDGALVRASRRTLVLVAIAGTLAVAAGAQAHTPDRNGWTAYPVSTYGAVISVFGSVALVLWLARLVAERSKTIMVVAVVVLAILGISTNFRYELVFPGVVVGGIALLVVPVTDRARAAAGRRAKLITGLAYLGTFFPILIVNRIYLANLCTDQDCYIGVRPELNTEAVKVAFYNFISPVPGLAGNELRDDLEEVGWADRYPVLPEWWSALIGLGIVLALLALWWGMNSSRLDTTADDDSRRRAEAVLLLVGAGLALLIALGTSAIMAMSERSHLLITEPGEPYRNVVVGWSALACAGVLTAIALGLMWRRYAIVPWTAMALVVATIVTLTLPGNMMALRSARISHEVSEAIYWEVAKGDTSDRSDERRCELYARIDHEVFPYARPPLKEWSNVTYELYHGEPFCAET